MRKLTRERDDAVRKLDDALELMQAEERKFQASQTSSGTVRRAAQRAAVAEEQVATLQHELHAAVDKNAALTKQLSTACDRLADVEHQLARAGSRGAAAADDAALQMNLAEARAARQEAEGERDAIHAEYEKATETARKRLEYAAQLIVELETKVEDLSADLADKETQVSILKDQLEQAQLDGVKQLSVRRRKEKSLRTRIKKLESGVTTAAAAPPKKKEDGAGSGDDEDPAASDSDDGINLSAIPVLFGPGASKASAAKDDESESATSSTAPPTPTAAAAAAANAEANESAAMWRIRAERAEAECAELRARLTKTEERLDAVQDRLVAIMTERSDAVSAPAAAAAVGAATAAAVANAPIVAPAGPPPAPPPMPSAPMKGNTPLKIGPKSDTSRTALARANNLGMDGIFEKIKSGGVNLRKVTSTDKRRPPTGNAFDQMVQQIKSKNYKIVKQIQKEPDGRLRFREAPNSVRPADLNEKRVLLDPRTGKPLGEDIEIGGDSKKDDDDDDNDDEDVKVTSKPASPAPASASPTPSARASSTSSQTPLATNSITVVEIDDDEEEGEPVTFDAAAVIADLSDSDAESGPPPEPPAELDELNAEELLD